MNGCDHPALVRRLWLFALTYMLLWSLVPPLLGTSPPLDVVESINWGHEWQWGYYKHPPLAPWLLYVFFRVFGRIGPFLLSQLSIAATLILVWCTGRRLMSPGRALLGAALTMGVAFYTQPALEFNHNIAQMPVWPALAWLFLAALQDGRQRQWLALGLVAGLGLLTKYTVLVFLACLGLYLLLTPARRRLCQRGPWLALGVALLVLLPHLLWLWHTGWLPLTYAEGRAMQVVGHNARASVLGFMLTQGLVHLPLGLIVLAAIAWRPQRSHAAAAGGRWHLHARHPGYLWAIALGPGLLLVAAALVLDLRLHDMWGSPMWAFSGLWVAAALPERWLPWLRPRLWAGLAAWLLLATALSAAFLAWDGPWRHRPARTDWPAQALAQQARQSWEEVSSCPLEVVAGGYWLAGLVALGQPHQPSLLDNDARFSPWVTSRRLRQQGALWLWQDEGDDVSPPNLLAAVAAAPDSGLHVRSGRWQLAWPRMPELAPLVVHWRAYVPAACIRAGH